MYSLQPTQIKAARAMLDWSQERLAEEAGVGVTTIRNIEMGNPPRGRTAEFIRRAVETAGLEFTHPEGVQRRQDINVFQGDKGTELFLEDMRDTIKARGGDVISMMESSEMLAHSCGAIGLKGIERLAQIGKVAPVKCLLPESAEVTIQIPQFQFREMISFSLMPPPFYIYGNKFVHVLPEDDGNFRYLVFTSTRIAYAQRTRFLALWEKGRPFTARSKA